MFYLGRQKAKIKHSTLTNDYSKGGLKDIDITAKFEALHLSWLSRFYSENKHPWTKILKSILIKYFTLDSIFFPNLDVDEHKLVQIPSFYRNIIKSWINISKHTPKTVSLILSESLWFNSHIKIENKSLAPSFLSLKNKFA